jgi:hypothetical protein
MYALSIIASAVGEWNYYIVGSAIEAVQLAAIVYFAWTWPKETPDGYVAASSSARSRCA